ncbi:MAG TPA: hypothetical protein VLA48_08620 [Nitrososphaeraceae archaeon]|nr:hypothetical protein [Nitrososphaeraceae archaeon]
MTLDLLFAVVFFVVVVCLLLSGIVTIDLNVTSSVIALAIS